MTVSAECSELTTELTKEKSVLLPICLLIGSLIFSLLLIELVFRLLTPEQYFEKRWNDRPKRYFLSQGTRDLRNYPYTVVKPANTIRVAVIGDSFTYSPLMQFDDAFSQRLGRWLNLNENQPKVEVLNLGISGYSTTDEIAVVKEAIRLNADLIILQITLNDPQIVHLNTGWKQSDLHLKEIQEKHPIFKYWKSLGFVMTRLYNRKTRNSYNDYYFSLFDNPESWNLYKQSTAKIQALCKSKDIKLVAALFPLFSHPFDDKYPFQRLHDMVNGYLNELGMTHLDLLNSYKGIPQDRLQVAPQKDLHPNEIAHRIAAEQIYRFLKSHHLLPREVFARVTVANRDGIWRKKD